MLTLIALLEKAPEGLTAEALSQATKRPLSIITAMLEHLEHSGRIEKREPDARCAVSRSCRHCPDNKGCLTARYYLRS